MGGGSAGNWGESAFAHHPLHGVLHQVDGARVEPLLNLLRDIAGRTGAKPAQVALAWLISLPGVVAIPGASSVEQLEFNVAAADIELNTDDRDALTEAARAFRPVPATPSRLPCARWQTSLARHRRIGPEPLPICGSRGV